MSVEELRARSVGRGRGSKQISRDSQGWAAELRPGPASGRPGVGSSPP